MGGKQKGGGVSKTNVTGRAKAEKPRAVEKVFECYRKPNGAIGMRSYWQELQEPPAGTPNRAQ